MSHPANPVPSSIRIQAAALIAAGIEGQARLEIKPEVIAQRALDIADAIIVETAKRELAEREEYENNSKVS